MSTIPVQTLIADDTFDIGLSSDLINGAYKSSSLTDLSNNVYTKISDLSSNVYSTLSTKENILSFNGSISKNSNTVSIDLSNYATNSSLSNLNVSNITSGIFLISRGGIGTTTLTSNQILIGIAATSIFQSANLTWNNTSNTLSASNFVGSGAGITS